jgi:hypothetical protein
MISHLIPYENIYLSVTLSLDEATAVADALALVQGKDKSLSAPAGELKRLLENGLERAAQLQDRRTK